MSDQDKLAGMMEKLFGGKPPEEKPTPRQEAGLAFMRIAQMAQDALDSSRKKGEATDER